MSHNLQADTMGNEVTIIKVIYVSVSPCMFKDLLSMRALVMHEMLLWNERKRRQFAWGLFWSKLGSLHGWVFKSYRNMYMHPPTCCMNVIWEAASARLIYNFTRFTGREVVKSFKYPNNKTRLYQAISYKSRLRINHKRNPILLLLQ